MCTAQFFLTATLSQSVARVICGTCQELVAGVQHNQKLTTETSLKNSIRGVDLARLFSTGLLAAVVSEQAVQHCS